MTFPESDLNGQAGLAAGELADEELSGDVWVTKTGKRIPVEKMTDDHLANAVQFMRRQVKIAEQIESSSWAGLATLHGEIATYYAEQECDRASDDVSDRRMLLRMLEAECKRRGLKVKAKKRKRWKIT